MTSGNDSKRRLRIVIINEFYSEGMGYTENCLSRALAKLGHEVHVVTSTFNVYANSPLYDVTYREFLGPREMPLGTKTVDGYTLHRLPTRKIAGYIQIDGLNDKIREIAPDIVHALEVASLQTYAVALTVPFSRFKLFCQTHQTMSVMRPYMLPGAGVSVDSIIYRLTRTLPTAIAALAVEHVYALTPDCMEVAIRYYGVPERKVSVLSLGADTETFHPVESDADTADRLALRASLGFSDTHIVCMYTGRFTKDKNPLVLAEAIDGLADIDPRFKGIFIGDGAQRADIAAKRNVQILPFMTHATLAAHYRAADIGIWPREESMSQIDAAASGVPLVVSHRIGEPKRAEGNGLMYQENDVSSMVGTLQVLAEPALRLKLGAVGREKMLAGFSWSKFAKTVEGGFLESLR